MFKMQVPEDLAAILHDQDLFNNNAEGLTTKDILKRCEKFVSLKKDNSNNNNDNFGEGSSSGNGDVQVVRHNNPQHQTYIEQGNNENQNANSTNIYPASSSIVNNESSIPVEQRAS